MTSETFCVFKEWLMYDTNERVSGKVLEMLMKKIPSSYFDSELRRRIAESLMRNGQFELLDKFVQKWSKQVFDTRKASYLCRKTIRN